MTDRQIPMCNYLPPHLVPAPYVSMRAFLQNFTSRTPDDVLSAWKAIAEDDARGGVNYYLEKKINERGYAVRGF